MSPIQIPVLCCDDPNGNEIYDFQFRSSPDRPNDRVFRRLGQVRATVSDALEALRQAHTRNEFPRAIIIDNWLGGDREPGAASEGGLRLMRAIADTYGERLSSDANSHGLVCVLWSGRMTPTLAHAFCQLGGHHAVDTNRFAPAWPQRLAVVWQALDGARWKPSPTPPKVIFTPDELELLPLLEAGKGNDEVRWILGWDADKLTRTRKTVYQRLKACKLIDVPYNAALTAALAEGALNGGAVWLPLYARPLLPA